MSESKTIIRRPPAAQGGPASCSSRSLSSRKTPKCFRTASFDPGVEEGGRSCFNLLNRRSSRRSKSSSAKGDSSDQVRGNLAGGERRPRVAQAGRPALSSGTAIRRRPCAGMPPRSASFANSASGTRKYTATSPSVRTSSRRTSGPDCDSIPPSQTPSPAKLRRGTADSTTHLSLYERPTDTTTPVPYADAQAANLAPAPPSSILVRIPGERGCDD